MPYTDLVTKVTRASGRLLLANRVTFVSGAGSGIGQAICRCFAQEGAIVVGGDLNTAAVDETLKKISAEFGHEEHHSSVTLDVSEENDIKKALSFIVGKFSKPPSVIVNAAGITRDNFLLQMSQEEFDDVVNVNLKGTFLMNKIFAGAMVEHGVKGSIVNIASIVGKNGNIGQCNYAASKAGVIGLSSTAAKELAKHGIRVNCVLPGFVTTPMTNSVPEKIKERIIKATPLGRFGEPQEIAEVVAFLASERGSFITGAAVDVNGGLSI